jgi:hypothetical protein
METQKAAEERKRQEQQIYQNIQQGKSTCACCGQIIADINAVNYLGQLYHEYCFACSSCGEGIEPLQGYQTGPNGPVCVK